MADIQMPQLGETVTEGTITKWFKAVGEHVAEDEVLFEVSTDKVDSEVPSPASGYLVEILVPEGETVEVGATLAILGDEPPSGAATPSSAEASAPATDDVAPSPASAPAPALAPDDVVADGEAAPAPAEAPRAADAASAPSPTASQPPTRTDGAHLLSPVVRRMLTEQGVDPALVPGTGVGGRVTRADAEAYLASRPAAATPAPSGARPATPTAATAAPRRAVARPAPMARSSEREQAVPLSNIRRRTGEHMVRSKSTSPHAASVVEVDYEQVDRVRAVHRDRWREEEGFSLTYLPFIARAVIDALEDFPHLNATMGEGELIVHNYVNLAIAVDLDFEGLLAPVVRDAEGKRLRAIAREIDALAGRARSKQLSADDITGGTFTLSNSGSFGSYLVLPIINQPQVAILSTDGVSRKPVVVTASDGTEAVAIHSVGLLAMTWDHRAFDGAYAAAFLARVREIIETRDWEAEL
jgi:2-oxoglutarate dehydrogenase E2 component (dihydrolipoamide succinyltransferase)